MLIGAGIGLCLLALPLASLAGSSSVPSTALGPLGWSCADVANAVNAGAYSAANQPNPLGVVSPSGGPLSSAIWGTPEIATTPGALPPNTLGIGPGDTGGISGSAANPAPAAAFLAGFQSTTEVDEFNPSSFPAGAEVISDRNVAVVNTARPQDVLPSGTVKHLSGNSDTGSGVPYVAVFPLIRGAPDFRHPAAGGVAASIELQNYGPTASNSAPALTSNGCKPGTGADHYSVIGFDLTPLIGSRLISGAAYAAYLLARDTDQHGPLGDHLWFFRAAPPGPQTGTLAGKIRACVNGQPSATEVPGGSINSAGSLSAVDTGSGVSFTVIPGSYPVSATAPRGFGFTPCGSLSYTVGAGGMTATYSHYLIVTAGGIQEGDLFVVPIGGAPAASSTGSLRGHIYACSGGQPTASEQPGGTITTSISGAASSQPNPASFGLLPPALYPAIATAPPGSQFVHCPSNDRQYTITNKGSTATYSRQLNVTPTSAATALFYVVPASPSPGANFVVTAAVSLSGSVPINTELTYTVTVTNTGTASGTPGLLTDSLAGSGGATCTIAIAATATQGTVTSPAGCPGDWTWDLTAVTLGAAGSATSTATFTVGIEALTPGTLVDTAVLPHSNCAQGSSSAQCTTTTPVNLMLTKTSSPAGSAPIAIGTTITYTITVTNPTAHDATSVLMVDQMSGTAGVTVDQSSFQTSPAVANNKVTCAVSDCTTFTWTWPTVAHGTSAVLKYSAVITGPASGASGTVTLTNTASTQGLPPASVSSSAVFSGVEATGMNTPTTGAFLSMNITLAAFLVFGGLSMVAIGVLTRRPER